MTLNPDVGLALVDYLIQEGQAVLTLAEEAKSDATKINDIETIVNALLPIAYQQITIIAGDLKTDYYYRCNVCSLACEKKLKFEPPIAVTLTYCDLKGIFGANFVKYNTVINA